MSTAGKPGTEPRTTEPFTSTQRAVPRLELTVERESGKPVARRVSLEGDLLRVGSHESNDLVVDDPRVSRFHCQLTRGPVAWSVRDLGSLNGTKIAGVSVRDADLPLPECRLSVGDSLIVVRELTSQTTEDLPQKVSFGGLYGKSPAMRRLFGVLTKVAKTEATVLIEGETGTGKEVVAHEIVQHGSRKAAPFVVVDCGAIPPNLIESELFGHAKGAFTGADHARIGAFEAANGGTVFLDEVGELPLDMQPKLLRALAEREIRRMGETQTRSVNVRVIAATNRRLEREVNAGRFREDLYFRLAVLTVRLPPLRDREGDVPLLVDAFVSELSAEDKRGMFDEARLSEMQAHAWPGNVRELRNYVERLLFAEAESLSPPSSSNAVESAPADVEVPFKVAKDRLVTDFERRYLAAVLAWAEGNVSRAARKARLDRMYVHRLLQHHGISARTR